MKSTNDLKIEVSRVYHILSMESWRAYPYHKQLEERIITLCWVIDDDSFTDKMMELIY